MLLVINNNNKQIISFYIYAVAKVKLTYLTFRALMIVEAMSWQETLTRVAYASRFVFIVTSTYCSTCASLASANLTS